ncbi:MAG TPA: sigma factor-like helix-turn-helix DNA-binding protein [Candidatus Saccharimonadales bacterium]|nr:sigma factor-like helix-turn-helix DNA-binding protein [Candidatus Saccharimonadales bacterium]
MTETSQPALNTEQAVRDILGTIDREREREIILRRFGLFERKETLEQIGELLGITRERVRQLEKTVLTRLKMSAGQGELPHIPAIQARFVTELTKHGNVARVADLAAWVGIVDGRIEQARVAFLAQLCPELTVIDEDDHYYLAACLSKVYDGKSLQTAVSKLVDAVKKLGEPSTIDKVAEAAGIGDETQATALASVSKQLATLGGLWGLIKWPMVNPKNIRDKIYVILKQHGKHMHFNDIAAAIKQSDFKRKDVTTQAIHNELIKDKRFVLVGRGIYALKEWGYKKGTVADIIADVLRKEGGPLHRDEIVKRVLQSRYVKETTILLNLQGKSQFKRVAKATYTLDEENDDETSGATPSAASATA